MSEPRLDALALTARLLEGVGAGELRWTLRCGVFGLAYSRYEDTIANVAMGCGPLLSVGQEKTPLEQGECVFRRLNLHTQGPAFLPAARSRRRRPLGAEPILSPFLFLGSSGLLKRFL